MKRVKNLTENKGLINTFKRFKSKNHTLKAILKKKYFFFTKFQQNLILKKKIFFNKKYFNKILFVYFKYKNPHYNLLIIKNFKKNFFKKILMFY